MYEFENIIGNENIINYLKTAIKLKRVPHSLVFSGAFGMGKKLLSFSLAKALLCEKSSENGACCNSCISCATFESKNNPDVFFVCGTKLKSIGVSDVREQIIKQMQTKPFKYNKKIFIVLEAHKLTTAAQNALLKTIEEPSSYGMFILLTENFNALLPTILSRCTIFKLKQLPVKHVASFLIEKQSIPKQQAFLIASISNGNIGRAISLCSDDELTNMYSYMLDLAANIKEFTILDAFKVSKELERFKEKMHECLDMLLIWYRDVLIFKETGNEAFLAQKYENFNNIEVNSRHYSTQKLIDCINSIFAAKFRLSQNASFQLTLEVLFMEFLESW